MDIGGYDKYAVRYGKGAELAKPAITDLLYVEKLRIF
jgi:hypothetical protein